MQKITLLLLAAFVTHCAVAQSGKVHFNVPVQTVKGDLNNDGIEDEIIITKDTQTETKPYRLQINFVQKDGSKKRIISSDKAIQPDDVSIGASFDTLTLNGNVITITEQLLRGHYEHKFRYQNGNFELIGYTEVQSDGIGKAYYTDFNLSTGIKIEKVENYENDKVISNEKTKLLIRPLPRLQDFEPYEDTRY